MTTACPSPLAVHYRSIRQLQAWRFALLVCGSLIAGAVLAQPNPQRHTVRPAQSQITLAEGKQSVSIPIEVTSNHVILPLSINGSEPMRIVLDTGMPGPGLMLYESDGVQSLKLGFNPTMQVEVSGAGGSGGGLRGKVAQSESLSLPGVSITQAMVVVIPAFEEMSTHHDGIIGWSLFNRFVVEIDFDQNRMTLHEPKTYQASEAAVVVPFVHRANVPHIQIGLPDPSGEMFSAEVVVDLGAAHALSLNTDSSEKISIPTHHIPTAVGRGLSGLLEGAVGRVARVQLANFDLSDVLVTFPVSEHQNPRGMDDLAGNLGTGILNRFTTTFDYANQRILLEPGASLKKPFLFDSIGIGLTYGRTLAVERLIPDSPASDAGILPGDVIARVNGRAVTGMDRARVRNLFEGEERVALTLLRDGKNIELELRPRKLI